MSSWTKAALVATAVVVPGGFVVVAVATALVHWKSQRSEKEREGADHTSTQRHEAAATERRRS